MVENLEKLNELNKKIKSKLEPYKQIRCTLSAKGIDSINCVSIEDEAVKEYLNFNLQYIVKKKIKQYEELASKLSLNYEDLAFVEENIDTI